MNFFECQSCGAFVESKASGLAVICPYCNSRNLKKAEDERRDLNLNCPFCGGAFSLPNSYNMSKCPYCSRSIFIKMSRDIHQFFLEPKKDPDQCREIAKEKGFYQEKKMVYIPFWAVRGILVSWILGNEKIETPIMSPSTARMGYSPYQMGPGSVPQSPRVTEQKTYRDFSSKVVFVSLGDYIARLIKNYNLGMRIYVETLSVKDYDKLSENADILRPLFDPDEAIDKLLDIAYKMPAVKDSVVVQSARLDMIGERFLLIYAPYYRFQKQGQSLLVDSFSGDSSRIDDKDLFDPSPKKLEDSIYSYKVSTYKGDKRYNMGFLELLPFSCPVCSMDLPEKKLDCFIQCGNCRTNFMIENGSLKEVNAHYVKLPDRFIDNTEKCRIKYYPYWRYRTIFYNSGKKIDDVRKLKVLFLGFIDRFNRTDEFYRTYMYIPAFGRVNTPGLDKISVIYTKMQIVFEYADNGDESYERAAVIYDQDDASNLAYTTLLKIMDLSRTSGIRRVRNNFLRLKEPELFYFPFMINPAGMHLDPVLNLNYMKNSFVAERSY